VFIRKSANGQVCYAQTKHKETIQKKNSNKNGQEDNLVEISKKSLDLYPWLNLLIVPTCHFKLLNKITLHYCK
jgi:hypothetical protein